MGFKIRYGVIQDVKKSLVSSKEVFMKVSAINLGKWISDYFRARCNTEDNLLNQDYRPNYPGSQLQSDQTATGEAAISFLNSGLGPANY